MLVRTAVCIVMLAVAAAGCSDDTAARDCTQPRNIKRQIEACTHGDRRQPEVGTGLQQPLPGL